MPVVRIITTTVTVVTQVTIRMPSNRLPPRRHESLPALAAFHPLAEILLRHVAERPALGTCYVKWPYLIPQVFPNELRHARQHDVLRLKRRQQFFGERNNVDNPVRQSPNRHFERVADRPPVAEMLVAVVEP